MQFFKTKKIIIIIAVLAISLAVGLLVFFFFQEEKQPLHKVYVVDTEKKINQNILPDLVDDKPLELKREEIIKNQAIDDAYLKFSAAGQDYSIVPASITLYPDGSIAGFSIMISDQIRALDVTVFDYNRAYYRGSDYYYLALRNQHAVVDQELIAKVVSSMSSDSPDFNNYREYYLSSFPDSLLKDPSLKNLMAYATEPYNGRCDKDVCPALGSKKEVTVSGIKGVEVIDEPTRNPYGEEVEYFADFRTTLLKNNVLYYFWSEVTEGNDFDLEKNEAIRQYRELVMSFEIK